MFTVFTVTGHCSLAIEEDCNTEPCRLIVYLQYTNTYDNGGISKNSTTSREVVIVEVVDSSTVGVEKVEHHC